MWSGLLHNASRLLPQSTDASETLLEGWFPWLFVESQGLHDDVAQGYLRLLGAMRTSLAMHSRLYALAKKARPVACTKRTETTRIAYGLQTVGVHWHVFAMAEEKDVFVSSVDGQRRSSQPVTTIWSGRVEEPRHMTQATAILRQIGAEAKPRLRSVRDWLTCVCVDYEGVSPSAHVPLTAGVAHLNLPPGIPIPGITHPISSSLLAVSSGTERSPITQPPTGNATPDPSWKPWVEPVQPQGALSSSATPAEPSKPKVFSSSTSGKSSTRPPSLTTTSSGPGAQIWAPAPRQLPVVWDSWRSAPPPAYQPTPPPFNYAATYEYAWPLPSASVTAGQRASSATPTSNPSTSWHSQRRVPPISVIPMKRSASRLSPLAQPSGPSSHGLFPNSFRHSPNTSRASSTTPA